MTIRNDGKQKRNIRVNAASTVLRTLGRVTLKKVFISEAPRSLDAFSSVAGIWESEFVIRDRAMGRFRYTCARMIALKE